MDAGVELIKWVPLAISFPYLIYAVLGVTYRKGSCTIMNEDAKQRDTHRSVAAVWTGFSFAAFLAVTFIDFSTTSKGRLSVALLYGSFIQHLFVFNLQGFKTRYWEDLLGDAAHEGAMLSLLIAVAILLAHSLDQGFLSTALSCATFSVWVMGFIWKTSAWRTLLSRMRS